MEDLITNVYSPKTESFDSKYDKTSKSLSLKWNVDSNIQNKIMLINLHYVDNQGKFSISNLKFDMSMESAVVDLNSITEAPKELEYITIYYVYGTAKIIETKDKKKVRIVSTVTNNDIVYTNYNGE